MAAGLGFKDFTTGEVLTAADVDGYLMQNIWVFASAAARDAAVTSPQEGNFAFLKDTNTTTYYTGSAWTNLDTTGMVNPMTTTGDTIYSSSGSTPARLGIGTAGQVLQVNSGATAPEWATPSGGGKVLQVVQATYSTQTTIASTSMTDTGLSASITPSSTNSKVLIIVNQVFFYTRNGNQLGVYGQIVRNSTSVYGGTVSYFEYDRDGAQGVVERWSAWSASYLDSPATTSSTTYKTQASLQTTLNSASSRWQPDSYVNNILLLEIGA
jgi:hypothetical protein